MFSPVVVRRMRTNQSIMSCRTLSMTYMTIQQLKCIYLYVFPYILVRISKVFHVGKLKLRN